MTIIDILLESGFTPYDILLIFFGPILGCIGGFIHAFLVDYEWNRMPTLEFTELTRSEERNLRASSRSKNRQGIWLIGRLLIGGIVGFGIGLFFVGSLSPEVSAVAKVLLICLVSGFGAPKLLGHIDSQLVRRLRSAIEGATEPR